MRAAPTLTAVQNTYQASTSAEKLRGKYYTPRELVRLILERVEATASDLILDPSCGDGEFLVGTIHYLADSDSSIDGEKLAGQLVGIDVSPVAVAEARDRVAKAIHQRFGVRIDTGDLRIHCANALDPETDGPLSQLLTGERGRLLVLGNPPYVEAKRLSPTEKARLKLLYPSAASGAPDLYLYFLHACAQWLRPGDRLGLVLPNRVLVNNHAKQIRENLLTRAQLWAIDFATRVELFPGAAVYPVVLYASGPGTPGRPVSLAAIDRQNDVLVRRTLPDLRTADYGLTRARTFFPSPKHELLAGVLCSMLQQLAQQRLGDLLDIRWTVSFHRQGLREQYVRQSPEGMGHPRRFLGGGTFAGNADVIRYQSGWNGWWIDYDEEALRKLGNSVPSLATFEGPKVVICQNGRTLRAAMVEETYVLKDTLLCGLPRALPHPLLEHPRALVGLLCSRAVHFFYSHVFYGSHVSGGYLHFLRTFLNDIPVGEWTANTASQVEALVSRRENTAPGSDASCLEAEIERCVEAALGVSLEQSLHLEQWAASDENWPLRNRTRRARSKIGTDHVTADR